MPGTLLSMALHHGTSSVTRGAQKLVGSLLSEENKVGTLFFSHAHFFDFKSIIPSAGSHGLSSGSIEGPPWEGPFHR